MSQQHKDASEPIKVAKIGALATICVAIIGSSTMLFTQRANERTPSPSSTSLPSPSSTPLEVDMTPPKLNEKTPSPSSTSLPSPSSTPLEVDKTPPKLIDTKPPMNETNVKIKSRMVASFNESIDLKSIKANTFEMHDSANKLVPVQVRYDNNNFTVTLTPTSPLKHNETYTITIQAGTKGLKDLAQNIMESDITWSFQTD